MSSLTIGYIKGLPLSKNYYGSLFQMDPSSIESVGSISSIFGQIGWGPYLFSNHFVLQGVLGANSESFSDFTLNSSQNQNTIQFKEFVGGGPITLTYGLSFKYIANNFMISIEYITQPPNRVFTPQITTYDSLNDNYNTGSFSPHKFNTSAYAITIEYRLL